MTEYVLPRCYFCGAELTLQCFPGTFSRQGLLYYARLVCEACEGAGPVAEDEREEYAKDRAIVYYGPLAVKAGRERVY